MTVLYDCMLSIYSTCLRIKQRDEFLNSFKVKSIFELGAIWFVLPFILKNGALLAILLAIDNQVTPSDDQLKKTTRQ